MTNQAKSNTIPGNSVPLGDMGLVFSLSIWFVGNKYIPATPQQWLGVVFACRPGIMLGDSLSLGCSSFTHVLYPEDRVKETKLFSPFLLLSLFTTDYWARGGVGFLQTVIQEARLMESLTF